MTTTSTRFFASRPLIPRDPTLFRPSPDVAGNKAIHQTSQHCNPQEEYEEELAPFAIKPLKYRFQLDDTDPDYYKSVLILDPRNSRPWNPNYELL